MNVSFTQNLTKYARLFSGRIFLQNRKMIGRPIILLAYDIPKRNLNTL